MNYALIFAGGTGQRMNTKDIPKQFLMIHGKPIILHTVEKFQKADCVDKIIIVCLDEWIEYLWEFVKNHNLNKVYSIISGGKTGQESIYFGLRKIKETSNVNDIVLIHDGVRPLIDVETINLNVETTLKFGNSITVTKAFETIISSDSTIIEEIYDRNLMYLARAPQTFNVDDLYKAHIKSNEEKISFIDSAMMMNHYGHKLQYVIGPNYNIKITTPIDYYMFKGILDIYENSQIDFTHEFLKK